LKRPIRKTTKRFFLFKDEVAQFGDLYRHELLASHRLPEGSVRIFVTVNKDFCEA
jgi:hypothetical protein